MNQILPFIVEAFAFVLVATVAQAAVRLAWAYFVVRRRLQEDAAETVAMASPLLKSETIRNPFLQWVQDATSLNDPNDRGRLRRDLVLAGVDHPTAPVFYVLTRFCLAIGLPFLMLFSQTLAAKPLTGISLTAAALLLCGLGLVAPRAVIDNRINARKAQLEHEFPDCLDLMVVCVEAGLGIEAAFIRVAQEVHESHPRISQEFGRLAQELNAGRSRVDALRAMADRTDVTPIRSFVGLLIQTDALGVSIGTTLRTYSTEMRQTRFLKAEEKAMRIPVLMTVPLVVCILPVIITATLLPAAIDIARTVIPTLKGIGH